MTQPPIYEEANRLNEEGKYNEALALYDQVLAQNPNHPALLATMGTIFVRSGSTTGMAISFLERAAEQGESLKRNDLLGEVLTNLGVAYKNAGLREKALEVMEKAIKVERTAATLTNYGNMFVENGDPMKAITYLDQAIKKDEKLAMSHWNIALALLETGQWERGWQEYEWGMLPGGMRPERKIKDKEQWPGPEKAPGCTVAIYGEQGIGDELMFASMIPDVLKTNKVILDCHPRLKTFFEKSFPGVKCYGTRKDKEITWPAQEQIDYQIAFGSLGKYYRNRREDFPGTAYLKADPLPGKPKDKFRVGISWTGGRLSQRIARRTVPLSWWSSILSNDCEFVSLQYTDCEQEIEVVEKSTGFRIKQFPEAKAIDYYETARLTASCDLVITVCTSILHVAGALGVPCWVMVPSRPDWRCQNTGPMPWYRSIRQYRQPSDDPNSWLPVVERIGFDLNEMLAKKYGKPLLQAVG